MLSKILFYIRVIPFNKLVLLPFFVNLQNSKKAINA